MEHILYQLSSGEYDITPKWDKTQQQLYDKLLAETDRVGAAFGEEYLDRLCDLDGELRQQQNFHYFHSGFVLGVRLMLECFTSP